MAMGKAFHIFFRQWILDNQPQLSPAIDWISLLGLGQSWSSGTPKTMTQSVYLYLYNVGPPVDSSVGEHNSNFTMVYGTYNYS